MRRSVLRVLVASSALLLVSGCSGSSGLELPQVPAAKIDVDTPRLRQLKQTAGLQACPRATGHNELPAVTLPCFGGGRAVALNKLSGPLVLSVWANWCGPCRHELPWYAAMAEEYAGQVAFLGLDWTDPQTELAMQRLADSGVTFPQVADPDMKVGRELPLRFSGPPFAAFVAADGSVTVKVGEFDSAGELRSWIETGLGAGR